MLISGKIEVIQSRFGDGGGLTVTAGEEVVRANQQVLAIKLAMLGACFEDLPMAAVQLAIARDMGEVSVRSNLVTSLLISIAALCFLGGRVSLLPAFRGMSTRMSAALEKQSSDETARMQKFRNRSPRGEAATCPVTGAKAA
mmetsp:Transcript_159082/g.486865  ORF Transcript_159082/g.486865 Transcript_159082/m.486865 type:complete len:142 (+) Transcript_159082:1039-1464(+)